MADRVDQRVVEYERDDEALEELLALREGWFETEIRLARLFARVESKAAYARLSAATVAEMASRMGYDGLRARDLCALGYALSALPDLEARLRERRITFAAAFQVGRLYREPETLEEDDEWLDWAETKRLVDLKRLVRQRFELFRHKAKHVHPFNASVPPWVHEDLERCRQLARGKVGGRITNGQLVTIVATNYLKDHDPLWGQQMPGGQARPRRMPPTDERLFDRGVPREVVRAIWERSGGKCEFGGCENTIQELCHLTPHRDGSGREVNDLVGGCRLHHKQYDLGWIEFLSWTKEDDLPVFVVKRSGEILAPKPRPEERERPDMPEWLCKAIGVRVPKNEEPPPEPDPPDGAGVVRDRSRPPQHRSITCKRRALAYERRPVTRS